MKLISLAKNLDFETEDQYFDYCITSYLNGNFEQSKRLFKNMSKADRKDFISYLNDCYESVNYTKVHQFYFNLL